MSLLKKATCLNSKIALFPNLVLLLLLSISLTVFSSFTHLFVRPVSAASLTSISDTMTRQEANVDSSHTIRFTTPSGVTEDETIIITFNSNFEDLDTAGIDFTDVDLTEDPDGTPEAEDLAATADTDSWGVGVSGDVLTLTAPSTAATYIAAAAVVELVIGTEATGGSDNFANPNLAATFVDIIFSGTFGDTGRTFVPILDDDFVSINADVESNIQFDIDIDNIGALGSGHDTDDAAPYSIDLQNLIFTDITDEDTVGVEEIYFDLSTNSTGGAIIQVQSGGVNLASASTGGSIPSATETLALETTDGGWGLACDEQFPSNNGAGDAGTLTEVSPFNVYGVTGGVGGVTTSFQTIFNTGGAAIQDADGTCSVRATAGTQTLDADDYTQTLFFRATATF